MQCNYFLAVISLRTSARKTHADLCFELSPKTENENALCLICTITDVWEWAWKFGTFADVGESAWKFGTFTDVWEWAWKFGNGHNRVVTGKAVVHCDCILIWIDESLREREIIFFSTLKTKCAIFYWWDRIRGLMSASGMPCCNPTGQTHMVDIYFMNAAS